MPLVSLEFSDKRNLCLLKLRVLFEFARAHYAVVALYPQEYIRELYEESVPESAPLTYK